MYVFTPCSLTNQPCASSECWFSQHSEDPLDYLSSRFSINWVAVVDNIELPLESFDAANELVVIVIARVIYT